MAVPNGAMTTETWCYIWTVLKTCPTFSAKLTSLENQSRRRKKTKPWIVKWSLVKAKSKYTFTKVKTCRFFPLRQAQSIPEHCRLQMQHAAETRCYHKKNGKVQHYWCSALIQHESQVFRVSVANLSKTWRDGSWTHFFFFFYNSSLFFAFISKPTFPTFNSFTTELSPPWGSLITNIFIFLHLSQKERNYKTNTEISMT